MEKHQRRQKSQDFSALGWAQLWEFSLLKAEQPKTQNPLGVVMWVLLAHN